MDRVKVGILFGGATEEHPVSVKSAREVAKHLDTGKYEPFWIGITKTGELEALRRARRGLGGRCRPVVLSPDSSVHGLLVLEDGKYRDDQPGRRAAGPARHDSARTVRCRVYWNSPASRTSAVTSRVPRCAWTSPSPTSSRRDAGIATPDFRTVTADEQVDPGPADLSRLRQAGPVGVVFRRQQGVRRRRAGGRGGGRAAVRLEGADRRGRRRQRDRLRRSWERRGAESPASWTASRCPTGSSRSTRRATPKAAPRTRRSSCPPTSRAEARALVHGDGEGRVPRPGVPGTVASGHVPEGRRDGGPQRGQHVARPDVLQPLPADDGRRRAAARRA